MSLLLGVAIVVLSVFGGFVAHGGELLAIWQPWEIVMICGAATGAFIIANPRATVFRVATTLKALLRGPRYGRGHYVALLQLMYALFSKGRRDGLFALEADIDDPESSEIFARFPEIAADPEAMTFIRDYMRLIIGGDMDAFQLENLMDVELETHHHRAAEPGHAVHRIADALPGFGIVAAVLGIVNTMGALGGPVEEIGTKVAAALVGTFLGILLAYGFVGPLATALNRYAEEECHYLTIIKTCILANLRGYAPKIAVEFGRKAIPDGLRPGFDELEAELQPARV